MSWHGMRGFLLVGEEDDVHVLRRPEHGGEVVAGALHDLLLAGSFVL